MATKRDATEALRANALWASDSPDDWRAALDAYAQRRDALNHEKLFSFRPYARISVDKLRAQVRLDGQRRPESDSECEGTCISKA